MKGKILLGLTAIWMLTGAAVPIQADDVWKFDAQRFVLNNCASHSRYFSDELDALFF